MLRKVVRVLRTRIIFQVYDSPKEELKRMEIFMNNVKYIEEFNSREDRTMTLGLNHFADMVRAAFFLPQIKFIGI